MTSFAYKTLLTGDRPLFLADAFLLKLLFNE